MTDSLQTISKLPHSQKFLSQTHFHLSFHWHCLCLSEGKYKPTDSPSLTPLPRRCLLSIFLPSFLLKGQRDSFPSRPGSFTCAFGPTSPTFSPTMTPSVLTLLHPSWILPSLASKVVKHSAIIQIKHGLTGLLVFLVTGLSWATVGQ